MRNRLFITLASTLLLSVALAMPGHLCAETGGDGGTPPAPAPGNGPPPPGDAPGNSNPNPNPNPPPKHPHMEMVAVADLPEAVQTTLKKEAPEVTKMAKITVNGTVTYRGRYKDDAGTAMNIVIGDDGSLINKGVARHHPKPPPAGGDAPAGNGGGNPPPPGQGPPPGEGTPPPPAPAGGESNK